MNRTTSKKTSLRSHKKRNFRVAKKNENDQEEDVIFPEIINASLVFRIAKLWNSEQGATEKYELDEKISFPEADMVFTSNLTAQLLLIKMKNEISALLSDASVQLMLTCQLCLKQFQETISIPSAERQFFYQKPNFGPEAVDIELINRKAMTIDLNQMVREEIILHFPLISVCSKRCKGLCPQCGKDRNTKACTCKKVELNEEYKPLKDLKKLL